MSRIVSANAFTNNEVGFLAWTLDGDIQDCLGFEITRIYLGANGESNEQVVLPAWVPFENQSNKDWKPQTTSVWPIQKLMWRDLTLRRKRSQAELHPGNGQRVQYLIRPLVKPGPGLQMVVNIPPKTYTGDAVALAYLDEGQTTNEIVLSSSYGSISANFTNGILSAQWLERALEEGGEQLTKDVVLQHISTPGDKIRNYLTGDVLDTLEELLNRAANEPGAKVHLALYELTDQALCDLLVKNKQLIHLILSNTSNGTNGWDGENSAVRQRLHNEHADIHDRMFNNGHIGHNKFAVLVGADGKPKAVMTGSTNWTPTGLCAQSNNCLIVESAEVAQDYIDYWNRLLDDTNQNFPLPNPLSAASTNVQGQAIRKADAIPPTMRVLDDQTQITTWYAPNTVATSKGKDVPPDLSAVYSVMRKAEHVILFACFLPSEAGKTSIIEEAISLGTMDTSLLVYGSVSSPLAMPNYVAKQPTDPAYDKGNIHVVLASAIGDDDLIGDFDKELLTVGEAIIHDKIVVIDPLGPNAAVITGSHNMGYKASYENDENLLIIQNNPKLIQAYAVHVLDVYDHYRFRAVQHDMAGKKGWDGHLSGDGQWLTYALTADKNALTLYFAQPQIKP